MNIQFNESWLALAHNLVEVVRVELNDIRCECHTDGQRRRKECREPHEVSEGRGEDGGTNESKSGGCGNDSREPLSVADAEKVATWRPGMVLTSSHC